jgi:hypothetical protein
MSRRHRISVVPEEMSPCGLFQRFNLELAVDVFLCYVVNSGQAAEWRIVRTVSPLNRTERDRIEDVLKRWCLIRHPNVQPLYAWWWLNPSQLCLIGYLSCSGDMKRYVRPIQSHLRVGVLRLWCNHILLGRRHLQSLVFNMSRIQVHLTDLLYDSTHGVVRWRLNSLLQQQPSSLISEDVAGDAETLLIRRCILLIFSLHEHQAHYVKPLSLRHFLIDGDKYSFLNSCVDNLTVVACSTEDSPVHHNNNDNTGSLWIDTSSLPPSRLLVDTPGTGRVDITDFDPLG